MKSYFVILNANIMESGLCLNAKILTNKWTSPVFISIQIYFYSKFIVIGNVWSVAMLESKHILWDLNAVIM